jgi:hypothetical protein
MFLEDRQPKGLAAREDVFQVILVCGLFGHHQLVG